MITNNIFQKALSIILFCLVATGSAMAQSGSSPKLIAIAKEEGRAYIYHADQIPLSHGYNVFRSTDGNNWTRLNEETIYPPSNGFELEYRLQEQFAIAQQLTDREDPQSVFLSLRSNTGIGLLANFASPEIAQEMGKLYIDEGAPVGKSAHYKFQLVDDLGNDTETAIQQKVELNVIEAPAPTALEVENKGSQVDIQWKYVPSSDQKSRYVIRFQILFRESEQQEWQIFNPEFLARTTGTTQFKYSADVPVAGQTYQFRVHAVDFTGAYSAGSEVAQLNVKENIPPAIVRNVQASEVSRYKSRITWPVSTELDLQGYHVYRARGDEEEYHKITEQVLPPLQTVYEDSIKTPGNQFRYKISALDTLGNESELSNPAYVFIEDYRIPDPVTELEATLIDNEIVHISWQNGEVPGGLRSFQIFRREQRRDSEGLWTMLNASAHTQNRYEDAGIGGTRFVEGTTLEYGIAVLSENGSASDTLITAVKIPDITPPEAPAFLEAKMQEAKRVGLTWNASRSGDVVQYRVYKREAGNPESENELLKEVEIGERYFRDENVPLNTEYIYSVFAVDSVGNVSTTAATDTLMTRSMHAPKSVRNVQAVQLDNGVTLAWERVEEEQIESYVIYKSEIATGVYKRVAETKAGENRWTDASGVAGQWYKVFSKDKAGKESRTAQATQAVKRN